MVPRTVPTRQSLSSDQPDLTPAALERLRALVGPAGPETADELLQAVRRELRLEYERGYLDGRGQARLAIKETPFQRFSRRLQRRARHGVREWMASSRQLRKAAFNLVLVVVLCAAAVAISMRVSASGDNKFAIPTSSR